MGTRTTVRPRGIPTWLLLFCIMAPVVQAIFTMMLPGSLFPVFAIALLTMIGIFILAKQCSILESENARLWSELAVAHRIGRTDEPSADR